MYWAVCNYRLKHLILSEKVTTRLSHKVATQLKEDFDLSLITILLRNASQITSLSYSFFLPVFTMTWGPKEVLGWREPQLRL
jgi:hypothetical protein